MIKERMSSNDYKKFEILQIISIVLISIDIVIFALILLYKLYDGIMSDSLFYKGEETGKYKINNIFEKFLSLLGLSDTSNVAWFIGVAWYLLQVVALFVILAYLGFKMYRKIYELQNMNNYSSQQLQGFIKDDTYDIIAMICIIILKLLVLIRWKYVRKNQENQEKKN